MSAILEPGLIPSEQFELLLEGTSIRGKEVIRALRDHLVYGVPGKQAWESHGSNKSQFYLNLGILRKESERARRLAPFYVGEVQPQ